MIAECSQTLTDVIPTKLKLQDTSEVLSSACALELMNVEFHSILTSMTRTSFVLLIECSLACSVQSCITHILAINNDNSVRSIVLSCLWCTEERVCEETTCISILTSIFELLKVYCECSFEEHVLKECILNWKVNKTDRFDAHEITK
jgi:hypothetical protein